MRLNQAKIDVKPIWWGCIDNPGVEFHHPDPTSPSQRRGDRMSPESMFKKATKAATTLIIGVLLCHTAVADNHGAEDPDAAKLKEYMGVANLVDGLKVYNRQQEALLADQQAEIDVLEQSIEDIATIKRQLGPLTERMILSLEAFIKLDIPFRTEQRLAVVDTLKYDLDRADLNSIEKFRRVMEAYAAEVEYATTKETYAGTVEVDGQSRQVNILRWGRVLLAFQTPDHSLTGVWDNESRGWKSLGSEYNDGVRDAMRMARGTMTEDIVLLPLSTPLSD